ncbi:hypothetical protein PF008_g29131 [Phytophthora fragariae]|uniref:Uncharacterized protein n=1 Tax=Phytophthora fragariae TaxID=53985 RepID=A0A6G0Q9A4_9STRA|nr:hypothetical protein PF008_g29131 [Phytophthora fragariae]
MQGWQGAAATKAIGGEHRWDVGPAGVDAEVDWNVKVTEKDGHVDELPVQLSWNGQVEVERDFDETEDVPEGEWSSVTRDLGKTAYRSEASFGALLEGTPVEDGVVCEGPGRMRSTADERRWVGVATTSVWDQGDVGFVKVGTVDAGCFGTVVTVIPCQTFPESYEELTEWATGGTYDASAKMMTDGLRIGVVKPYSDTPTLNVQQGGSDGELAFEFSDDDMNLTEDREFLKAVHGGSDDIRCQYLDACSKHVRTDVQDPRPN